jgi:DNA-binding NtrC family response regulator
MDELFFEPLQKRILVSQLIVRTLLVVDDEPMMLEALSDILSPLGIGLVQAENADEALKILSQTNVTAILSDIRMPGFSGLEFLEKLRSTGNNVPFVFLTASPDKENLHRALQLGAIDFLEKPFDAEHLKEVVFKLLEIGVKQREIESLGHATVTELPKINQEKNHSDDVAKKSKLINLLRIKLPWQKAK